MNRILSCLVIFISIAELYSQDKPKFTLGGTAETLETRFGKESDKSKTNAYLITGYKDAQVGIEKRNGRDLASFEYRSQNFYFSAGHRFKPINGFYILRDENFYSAFQNPTQGIIQQPLKQSIWLGLNPNSWSAGIFMGKEISEKNLSVYFKTPKDIFSYAYSPETEIHFSALNVRDQKIFNSHYLTVSAQGIGRRETFNGYFNTKWFIPKEGIEIESSNYKEVNNQVFVINRDDLRGEANSRGNLIKIARFHYDRLEYFQLDSLNKTEKVFGANTSVFSGKFGAICASARGYQKFEKDQALQDTTALGVSYEYRLLSSEFMLRYEERKNKDHLAELKYTVRPIPEWRFEISSLVQKESNQFRSMFEQWSDGENINTILTDRAYAFKLKVIGSFIVFNISGSRRKNNAGEVYFANIQFKQEF